ncbi:probable NADH dehydrogenase [Lingula anatina]|uniref:Probable NADH dehydrogenase n=1 Tax=Lingula anatina TaxID=7574 RepID=A0A1S3INX7_LINAN|nr:probable NADH dehydrogenase [Lingula anatina]XP_013399907.1 probable NADH dehydrogenase [Lingula anatina]XP_013399908.1 probable NADH dehydrogenase [Lingula anatina]XP_013399909.1 probable NADH dehydrogenase [Lingula anatina]XP_013399910.1 probable NADH dehydrogenase [Lingula anatina]XP_013399911.1 probable NADH dehydrogenase [Lingula anatina]XP_013399912.1 probable NADH dehydrogenase [Lingula anatina]XP_013399913.1 probable NADH dehydrogenase [Lingula anatina]|eukprot:XP_013399906.1 probable NADH dehydrogenase [Lingula anatina]
MELLSRAQLLVPRFLITKSVKTSLKDISAQEYLSSRKYVTFPMNCDNPVRKLYKLLSGAFSKDPPEDGDSSGSKPLISPIRTQNSGRKRLVILGTGWGGYSVLKNIDKKLYDVIVVSPRNHFLFTPLLCSTTVGTLEFRSIIEPVRNSGFRKSDHFHLARAIKLNFEEKTLECESSLKPGSKYVLEFDKLVIAVGARSNAFNVPGVEEHAIFLKEIVHAQRIRRRIISNFELALQPHISPAEKQRLLHTVIVGGGPTGIEFGAELYDFIKTDVSRLYLNTKAEIQTTLVESQQILASFDKRLQAYAERKIKERPNFHLIKSNVTEVKADSVTLQDGTVIPCGLVVWSAGLAPRPFTQFLDSPKNNRGQIMTDQYLRVLGDPTGNVYALGDCAEVEHMPLPCTAQVAERQGRYICKALCEKNPADVKPFVFKSLGMLAYIGDYKALTDMPEVKLRGFPSWVLWRSAYLTRLGSWRLRMQVPLDWTKTLLYGRDTSRF